jgi:prepilin-type N-terminal cleavage/methylation domain-containing protein
MRQGGFTLLEMIVVLAILGLATALVGPSAIRGIDSWRRQAELDSLLDQIRAMPGNARASGRAIVISDASLQGKDPPLRVAGEWTLGAPEPWKVNANGVCPGGEITIGNRHGNRTIVVSAPFCDPVLQP